MTDPRSCSGSTVLNSQRFSFLWEKFYLTKKVLNEALKGLHDYLGFNGRIFLSLVMPDELIDKLSTKDYLKLIGDLRPDATMIPDKLYLQ